MAVKNKFGSTYTYEDLYDTQEALDKGILGSVSVPTKNVYSNKGTGQVVGEGPVYDQGYSNNPLNLQDNKNTFASILGQTNAIEANRKKRAEQEKSAGQGFGLQSSILGGGPF